MNKLTKQRSLATKEEGQDLGGNCKLHEVRKSEWTKIPLVDVEMT